MARLVEVVKSLFEKRTTAPAKAVIIQTIASETVERRTELYHPPGISSAPTEEDRAIEIPLGSGVKVAIATHNYKVEVEPDAGEIIIYSTNSDGDTVQATIKLTDDGNIEFNGDTYNLVMYQALASELSKFITSLNSHTHPAHGSPPSTPMSLDISSAKTDTLWTDG